MQDPQVEAESVEFEVKPQAPRLRTRTAGLAVAAIVVLAAAGVFAVALTGTAAPGGDPLAQVMPANTLFYFSMATRPDQRPHFDVVAEAWRGSKEAQQIEDSLNAALTFSGYDWDWETDILPWLGDRAAVAVVELPTESADSAPNYHPPPFIVFAVQTRDRARSDAFLADFRSQRESDLHDNSAIFDEVYRGVSIAYIAYDSEFSPYGEAYATINDVIVLAAGGRDHLKSVIDTALDGTSLADSVNFKAMMGALPSPNVGAAYLDYASFMDVMIEASSSTSEVIVSVIGGDATEAEKRMEEERLRREQQQARLRDMMQAFGGAGAAMTYEPSGIRVDFAMQVFPDRLPDSLRDLYEFDWPVASNRIFDSFPSSAVVAANMSSPVAGWAALLDNPEWLNLTFGSYPFVGDVAEKLAELEALAGVDLKADLLDLFKGESAIAVLPAPDRPQPPANDPYPSVFPYNPRSPFAFALMLDASDPARALDSLNRLVETVYQSSTSSFLTVQPLDSLQGSALLKPDGEAWLAYAAIDGWLVIGSDPSTLYAIAGGDQSPLSADATFQSAMSVLPADRLASGYVRLEPFWNALFGSSFDDGCDACNYLRPFQWMSFAGELPDATSGIQRGVLHIGLEAGER